MIVAGTGHRPDKLGGYSDEAYNKLKKIANIALWNIGLNLSKDAEYKVISGMALGWDQALCEAAIELNIPVIAAVPFKGQEDAWFKASKDKYQDLLSKCSEIVIVSDGKYSADKMQIRNIWMVDHCDILLALWNGTKGGTKNCLDYAKTKLSEDKIINLYSEWSKL